MFLIFLLPLLCYIGVTFSSEPNPLAVTPAGIFEGRKLRSPDGNEYLAFKGIPYALPPSGKKRWERPEPRPRFENVYNASEFGPACVQSSTTLVQSEDCLVLDVYAPVSGAGAFYHNDTRALELLYILVDHEAVDESVRTGATLPVMVWIHGGSYRAGAGRQHDSWKVVTEQDVVVVVVQYRLGTLGFLSTGDQEMPGNYGLWDQLLGIKWVQKNIRGFGGNASMVTLVGESAGAASVSQHTLSRHASGLFQRAVMMSGTATASWSINRKPRATFDTLSDNAKCGDPSVSATTRIACLRTLPAEQLQAAALKTEAGDFVTFVPTIDGDFFPSDIDNLLNNRSYLASVGFYDYEVMLGVLNNEGVVMFPNLRNAIPNIVNGRRVPFAAETVLLDGLLKMELADDYAPDAMDVVTNRYLYPREEGASSTPVQKVFDVYTDASFVVPALKYLRHHQDWDGCGASSSISSFASTVVPTKQTSTSVNQGFPLPSSTSSSSLESTPLSATTATFTPKSPAATPTSTNSTTATPLSEQLNPSVTANPAPDADSSVDTTLLLTVNSSTSTLTRSSSSPTTTSAATTTAHPTLALSPTSVPSPATMSNPTSTLQCSRRARALLYYFDWRPAVTQDTIFQGMPHGLDVHYLFGLNNRTFATYLDPGKDVAVPQEDHNVSRLYGAMIGAFVKTGNPSHWLRTEGLVNEEWISFNASDETFLTFSSTPRISSHLHASAASLWIDLLPRVQSRWRQQRTTTPTTTTTAPPPAASDPPQKLTDLGLTESQANRTLIALIAVGAVLLVINIGLVLACCGVCKQKKSQAYVADEKGLDTAEL